MPKTLGFGIISFLMPKTLGFGIISFLMPKHWDNYMEGRGARLVAGPLFSLGLAINEKKKKTLG